MRFPLTLVTLVLTAAFALAIVPMAFGSRPPSGHCPPGFVLTDASDSPADDHNGDTSICVKTVAENTPASGPLYVDNAVQNQVG
jgi:hypothetical protein